MNILMMTNTFTPHVGGVARAVEAFTTEYCKRGHGVMVVAPEHENMPENEVDVVRIPAIQNFNGSYFSVVLSTAGYLTDVKDPQTIREIPLNDQYLSQEKKSPFRKSRSCPRERLFPRVGAYRGD